MLKKLLGRHRAMQIGVTLLGASALAVGFASPAFAAQSVNNGNADNANAQNYVVVQGGSNTAYGVMSAEAPCSTRPQVVTWSGSTAPPPPRRSRSTTAARARYRVGHDRGGHAAAGCIGGDLHGRRVGGGPEEPHLAVGIGSVHQTSHPVTRSPTAVASSRSATRSSRRSRTA